MHCKLEINGPVDWLSLKKNILLFAGNALENGLRQVGREDVVKKSMYNVEVVEDELEAAAQRAAMDQSGESLHTYWSNIVQLSRQFTYLLDLYWPIRWQLT